MAERFIEPKYEEAARALSQAGCIKFGEFILASGLPSPVYINMRRLRSFPEEKLHVILAYEDLLSNLRFDLLADVPTAATPLVASLSDRLLIPQITPRMDIKTYGSGDRIDGAYADGQMAVVIDDLITTSKSKMETIQVLTEEGLIVRDVVVLVDREQGGREQLQQAGYYLHSAFTMTNLMRFYNEVGIVNPQQFEIVMNYLHKS